MHTVEMLSEAIELARRLGYQIREDQLEGAGGGHCRIRGRKWLLLDITQSADEQLHDVLDAIRENGPPAERLKEAYPEISPELAEELGKPGDRGLGTGVRGECGMRDAEGGRWQWAA